MFKKPKCFITYCNKDINKNQIEVLVEWMRKVCLQKIEFIYDNGVGYHSSFFEFESKIFDADAIIIFLSPKYKKRCLDEINTGVSREYRKILSIIENNKRIQSQDEDEFIENRKLIFPILYKGCPESSITNELEGYRYLDISNISKFAESKNGNIVVSSSFVNFAEKKFNDIFKEIYTSNIEKTLEFKDEYEKMLKNLFINTKGEYINLPDDLFIETDAFKNIIKQFKYILIGRKGSGKTTVKKTISNIIGGNYKGIISIKADHFQINETYELLFKNEKIDSDMENYLSKIDSYELIWYAFIILYCMFVVYKEYLCDNLTNQEQIEHIQNIEKTISNIFKDEKTIAKLSDQEVTKIIYSYVLSNLDVYIEEIIRNSRNDIKYYIVDIKQLYTPERFLIYLIGENAYLDFVFIIKKCTKKIFITLDGFDAQFEFFKITTMQIADENEKLKRTEFEDYWLLIFIETLMQLKNESILSDIIDLCLTLPVDRIESIKMLNRDFYKYHSHTIAINWTGKDLVKLIVMRLLYLNCNDLKTVSVEGDYKTLDFIMEKYYNKLPKLIYLDRSECISMPLFLYILRKSFWRPRDIIRYYNCILAINSSQNNFSNISIKRALKDEAYKIIQDEFIGEFSSVYTNLKDVINLFNNKKQVLTYNEIYKLLKNTSIIINGSKPEDDFDKKISILYIIGFLGLNPPNEYITSQYLHDEYAFVFTEGTSVLRALLNSDIKMKCKFVVHPIFTEYLTLNVDYNKIICNYTWEYIDKINSNNIDYAFYED